MSAAVTPHDFPEIGWQGHWIWVPEEPIKPSGSLSAGINPQAPETHGLFRKRVHLDQVPDRVPARVSADSRYALFVNGEEVFRGPIRSQPRRLHYDLRVTVDSPVPVAVDLVGQPARDLPAGRHEIAVQ